jgi:hypothetical protein
VERFNLVVVAPPDFAHARAYSGTASFISWGLRRLGHPARVAENQIVRDAVNIVFGAHYLAPELAATLPPSTIVFNTEQVHRDAPFASELLPFAQRFVTWDFDRANVAAWRELGAMHVQYIQPGYLPELTTIDPATPADLDVLFFGQVNPRRAAVLARFAQAGVRVEIAQNLYGAERDALLARAKIVLNVHTHDDSVLEMARVVDTLANHRPLVTELGPRARVDDDLREGLLGGPANALPALCRALLDDAPLRDALAERGFQALYRRDFTATLRAALALRN